MPIDLAKARQNAFFFPALLPSTPQLLPIAGKIALGSGSEVLINFFKGACICQQIDAHAGRDAEMISTVGADKVMRLQICKKTHFLTGRADAAKFIRHLRSRRRTAFLPFKIDIWI